MMAKLKKIALFFLEYAYALVSCVYLFTIGFLFVKNRALILQICTHFGFGRRKGIIPVVELSELVSPKISIQISESVLRLGNIAFSEVACLAALIKHYNSAAIFEIGTFDGRTTLEMAVNSRDDVRIYTLDLPKEKINATALPLADGEKQYIDKDAPGERFKGTPWEKKILQLYGDSATFDFSPYFNSIDFVFVDGSHAYEYVLHDVKVAMKLLRGGKGVIACHDYISWQGVTRALNQLYRTLPEFKNLKHIKDTSLVVLCVDGGK